MEGTGGKLVGEAGPAVLSNLSPVSTTVTLCLRTILSDAIGCLLEEVQEEKVCGMGLVMLWLSGHAGHLLSLPII